MSSFLRLASLAVLLAAPAALSAQNSQTAAARPARSQTSGFMAGLTVNAASLGAWGDSGPTSGGGVGARLGYGFSRFLIFGGLDAGVMTSGKSNREHGLGHVDLGVRVSLGSTASALRPYVQAGGLGIVSIEGEGADEVTTSGNGFSAGLGAEYFVRRSLAVDLGVSRTRGSFRTVRSAGEEKSGLDIGYATTRLTLGMNWRP